MPSPALSRSDSVMVNCRINPAAPSTRPIQVTVVFTEPSNALLPSADKTVNGDQEQVEDHNKDHQDADTDRNAKVTLGGMSRDREGRIEDGVGVFACGQATKQNVGHVADAGNEHRWYVAKSQAAMGIEGAP